MEETNERRRRRNARANWPGEIVLAGTEKPRLRAPDFTKQRLDEMWQHCVHQWQASGREVAQIPRSEWPGEVFRIQTSSENGAKD